MTSLDQNEPARPLPDQRPADRPPALPAAPGKAGRCAVAAAGGPDGAVGAGAGAGSGTGTGAGSGSGSDSSVPRPRGAVEGTPQIDVRESDRESDREGDREDCVTEGGIRGGGVSVDRGREPAAPGPRPEPDPGPSAVTAANLRAGLGQRLRARYERGMTLAELSAACHRPQEEIRELLSRAGADLSPPAGAGGGGRTDGGLRAPNADRVALPRTAQASSVPVARPTVVPPPVRAEGATARTKRPSPARRLSRLHPRGPAVDATAPPAVQPADGPTGAHGSAEPAGPETPLGILIGGTPNRPEPESRPAAERYVLVDARMVRPGRGSCLVVLPSWRPAIAVSVPTEQLMEATGLGFDQLPGAELSVLIDPEALHDRELGLHGWRTGSVARGGARLRRG